ncbi:phenylalanine--tRNA ligase beta subunit-like [Paramacrobiotus metropolitanus]|uniref:phenylalanine--tRNA ligase beta subunit-like n=1 Tax=Paramacrobiotus metropolitanus TaxID=2943436 RepID=UPI002445F856|nr:phenylalanine--tRNA ligase beta subunit-like [Paramacrobiotus metropolitanus]
MPTISVKRDELFAILGRTYSDKEFDELCFEYGIELDEVTTEKQIALREHEDTKNASEQVIYKIEIPANRYDLLCLEGLSQALLVFLSKAPFPLYRLSASSCNESLQRIRLQPATAQIRPYVVGAVLRNITFTPSSYASFIDLQDKLHQNLCRKRTLVSMGTHDLDTVQGPFEYDALPPEQIVFKPLNQTKEYNGRELMELYSTDNHLKHFLHIIKDSPVYPVIKDKNGVVMSLPPIINGEHSKITLKTKNVFIEITATDRNKALIVLDTLVTMFSVHCDPKFIIEPVNVEEAENGAWDENFPKLEYRKMKICVSDINKKAGISVSGETMCALVEKMCLRAAVCGTDEIEVIIPPTRHDILHPCDLVEDVAIAYGFNKIETRLPTSATIAKQFNINRVTDLLRKEIVAAGYTEALTFALCSIEDIAKKLRHDIGDREAVEIANPKTLEFQVARTTLIPGLLKTIAGNKKMPLPMKVFEISDVVRKDATKDVGARNIRHFCAAYYGKTSGFEIVHGLLDRFMQLLGIPWGKENKKGYCIQAGSDSTFFPGRCAEVIALGKRVGVFGVLHPEVLNDFELVNPCSVLEIDIEPFIDTESDESELND